MLYYAGLSAATLAGGNYGFLMRRKPKIVLEKLKVNWKLISRLSKVKGNFSKPHRLQNRKERRFATGAARMLSKKKRVKPSSSLVVSFRLTDSLRAFLSREKSALATEVEGRDKVGRDSRLTRGFKLNQPISCSQLITAGNEQVSTRQFFSQMNTVSALKESERRKGLLLRIKLPGQHTSCNPSSGNVSVRKCCVREKATIAERKDSVGDSEPTQNHQLVEAVGTKVVEQSQDGEGKEDTAPLPEGEVIVVDSTDDPDDPNDRPLLQPVDSVTELSTPQSNELLDVEETASQTVTKVRIKPGKKAGVLKRRCYRKQVGLATLSSEDEQEEIRRRRKRKLSGEGQFGEGKKRKLKVSANSC